MRFEQLTRRLADAPGRVVWVLVALFVLVSPGFVRVSREAVQGLRAQRAPAEFGVRPVAVLELHCRDGVFRSPCLGQVARVTRSLEARAESAGSVRSLGNAHVTRARHGALRLEPALPLLPAGEAELREAHGRVRADDTLMRRFVAPDARSTFVYVELARGAGASEARALLASVRAELERAPEISLTLRGFGPVERSDTARFSAALVLLALALALAPGGWRVGALAGIGALAFAAVAHALLRLLGQPGSALLGTAPALLAASALAASFALIQCARVEHRREPSPRTSVATALAAVGPALAIGALVSVAGLATLLALGSQSPCARGFVAASGIAAALVAYPLGIPFAGLLARPELLSRGPGELASVLARRVERVFVRPRIVVGVSLLALALTGIALRAVAPEPGALLLETHVLDSGARGGALEPVFLERVAEFQRDASRHPGFVGSSSLVDTVVAPANRALHDGHPLFATVPLTREEVVRALRPWRELDRSLLDGQLDRERRRVAVRVWSVADVAASAPIAPRSIASALFAVVVAGSLGGALLRSARGGLICALPAATTAAIVLGLASAFAGGVHDATSPLAALAAGGSAGFGLQLLARIRALLEAGAQLDVALSLALRETGPSFASAAFASAALGAAISFGSSLPATQIVLAGAAPLVSAASALAITPALVRSGQARFFSERSDQREREQRSVPIRYSGRR